MNLIDVRNNWDRFGRTDPLFAVLSDPHRKDGRWDRAEFFLSGQVEVDKVLERVRAVATAAGTTVAHTRALDFGCGVGRLSLGLARHFRRVDGVDIARSMIDAANTHRRRRNGCHFHLNTTDDLSLFKDGTFDLVYTAHVLQHMEPRYARSYIKEFFRVLRPGGIAMFELVTTEVEGDGKPIPDSGFRVTLTPEDPPATMSPGESRALAVTVHNDEASTLPAAGVNGWYLVTVANHWSHDGTRKIVDDGRTKIPYDLSAGQECSVELRVTAPTEPGRWTLELDCVQEGVAWFEDKGSTVTTVPICITEPVPTPSRRLIPRRRRQAVDDEPEAVMEMHGNPEEDIRRLVAGLGGSVLSVFDWDEISNERSYDWNRRGFICRK